MNDYEKTIAVLQDRVRALEERFTLCDGAVAEPKWSPVGGEYYVCNGNAIRAPSSMNAPREFGIERPTKEQAERAAIEMRKFNRLLALRDELCGDYVVRWVVSENYLIYYDYEDGKYAYCSNCIMETISAVYFTTKESAQRACNMLNSGEVEL
jgi:hypothetical protein